MGKNAGGAGRTGRRASQGATSGPVAARELLGPTRTYTMDSDSDGESTFYQFTTASGNEVRLVVARYLNAASVGFEVNGQTVRNGIPQDEASATSMRLLRLIREDARKRPDGFSYQGQAETQDRLGAQRAMAYEAIGLSRPLEAEPGRDQYGTVVGGKIRPDTEGLRQYEGAGYERYNAQWAAYKTAARNQKNAAR